MADEQCEFLEYEVDSLGEKLQAQRDLHTAEMTSLKEELETQKEARAAELASLREELQVLTKQAIRERTDRKDLESSDSGPRQTARSSRT